jgi:hypothetical protein
LDHSAHWISFAWFFQFWFGFEYVFSNSPQVQMATFGCIDAVVEAMRHNPKTRGIQLHGCSAIRVMATSMEAQVGDVVQCVWICVCVYFGLRKCFRSQLKCN